MEESKDLKKLSQQRFGKFARNYVTSEVHARGTELDRLVEIANPRPDWIALDIATGGGHTAIKFAPLVAQMVATDITPKMLEAAEKFLKSQGIENAIFKIADAENLPFERETFDLVTCRIAPHHFTDCPRFVKEGAHVLKSGSMLLVQDHVSSEDEECSRYSDLFEQTRDPSHNHSYSESEWVKMFQNAGLKVEYKEHFTRRHEFVTWVERQGCNPETIQKLIEMIPKAPRAFLDWRDPQDFGTPEATFVDHQIIIAGRKN